MASLETPNSRFLFVSLFHSFQSSRSLFHLVLSLFTNNTFLCPAVLASSYGWSTDLRHFAVQFNDNGAFRHNAGLFQKNADITIITITEILKGWVLVDDMIHGMDFD